MFKEHKKLYKAGKHWLAATFTVATVALFAGGMSQNVQADEGTPVTTTQSVSSQAQSNSGDQANNSTVNTTEVQEPSTTSPAKTADSTVADGQQNNENQDVTVSQAKASAGNQWTRFSGGWSYTDSQGNWLYNQWQNINNNWYYFNNGGYAQTGWYQSGAGRWYYFDNNNAWALTGWQNINNRWYHFDSANAWADQGWQRINNNWYYFDYNNAWAQEGWFRTAAGNWYYFDPTNAWADTGWQWINGSWYYFDPANAWMETGWQTIGNKSYYFEPSGAWNANKTNGSWIKDDSGNWEYRLPNGTLATGWQQIGNDWYYFWGTKAMATDVEESGQQVEGVNTPGPGAGDYYVGQDGRMVKNGWINSHGGWYYADGSHNGRLYGEGWHLINNDWYYFSYDAMQSDVVENGQQPEGVDTPGPGAGNYYVGKDGRMVKNGWINSYGHWYYADGSRGGQLYGEGWHTIDNKSYHFNIYGVWDQ